MEGVGRRVASAPVGDSCRHTYLVDAFSFSGGKQAATVHEPARFKGSINK